MGRGRSRDGIRKRSKAEDLLLLMKPKAVRKWLEDKPPYVELDGRYYSRNLLRAAVHGRPVEPEPTRLVVRSDGLLTLEGARGRVRYRYVLRPVDGPLYWRKNQQWFMRREKRLWRQLRQQPQQPQQSGGGA